ncbi:hypothetical protein GCM10020221_30320 [Streptomyces thioluteus]|uniref:Uncharacterized protein n=1 Tax=Streptomyces thioluteus TaxID=66431 RepID=A0ABN3WYY2_STRTU
MPGVGYTTIVTRYDEVVTPYRTQFLSGPKVRNVLIQDLCAVDLSEHLTIGTIDRIAFHEVANALDPANATPTTCASAVTAERPRREGESAETVRTNVCRAH